MSGPEAVAGSTPSSTDSHSGLGLLFLFAVATLLVVLAVWAVGAFGGWWILAGAVVIHLATTTAVLLGLTRALADDEKAGPAPKPVRAQHLHRGALPAS